MNIIEHTINWYKGEMFESTIIGVVGLIIVILSCIFWKVGKTPNAQAMFIPLLVVGLLLGTAGYFITTNNAKTLKSIQETNIENMLEFAKSEKQRVEDFQALYLYTKIGATIAFFVALSFFFFTDNKTLQAIGIALIIIGLAGLTIDYFSKERADVYYADLLKYLN